MYSMTNLYSFTLKNIIAGDCDSDSQCKPGLRCYFRSDSSPVPGCNGYGEYSKDYCYDPGIGNTVQARPTPRPPAPTRRPPTSPNFQLKYLSRVSNKNCRTRQCGKCQVRMLSSLMTVLFNLWLFNTPLHSKRSVGMHFRSSNLVFHHFEFTTSGRL